MLGGSTNEQGKDTAFGRRKVKRKWEPNLYRRVNKATESELLVLNEYDGIENRFRRSGSR
jgi:ribosomal protein L28